MNSFWGFIERNEFWVGFIAGAAFWWLIQLIQPLTRSLRQAIRQRLLLKKESRFVRLETTLRDELFDWLQSKHLAASLFSLNEILIEPSLLAPPILTEPGATKLKEDITHTIPYMPDWPQMAAVYKANKLKLIEAMQGGANLALIGRAGSGKTTALAHLAGVLCRPGNLSSQPEIQIPVWLNACDLISKTSDPSDHIDRIIQSLKIYLKLSLDAKLIEYINHLFISGRIILLVDGLDELPPEDTTRCVDWLKTSIEKYPNTQIIVTARQDYFDGLSKIHFTPIAMAAWDYDLKRQYLELWQTLWQQHIQPDTQIDLAILNAWGLNDAYPTTPLEWTLKVWALYAGDLVGPSYLDMMEAYIRRISSGIPHCRSILEYLASRLHATGQPCSAAQEIQLWLTNFEQDRKTLDQQNGTNTTATSSQSITNWMPSQFLQEFFERGVLTSRGLDKVSFSHVTIFAYLAGVNNDLKDLPLIDVETPGWLVSNELIKALCLRYENSSIIDQLIDHSQDPLQDRLLELGYWLINAPEKLLWRNKILRLLAGIVQSDKYPVAIKSRAITAMVYSKSAGITAFVKQLLESTTPTHRRLAALASGLLKDNKFVPDLCELLHDPVSEVQRAACLSLVAIDNRPALEAVAEALLSGDEKLQQFAAEALANHPTEGHPTLQEGAGIDDILVRRAVVFGLRRLTHLAWAKEILEKMRVSEDQWIVKDAANQALINIVHIDQRIFINLPPIWEIPWLIAFAGEQGQGVTRGEEAEDILLLALKSGNNEQRCAAMDILRYTGSDKGIPIHYQNLYNDDPLIQESEINTIWHLARTGIKFPSPIQYGLV